MDAIMEYQYTILPDGAKKISGQNYGAEPAIAGTLI